MSTIANAVPRAEASRPRVGVLFIGLDSADPPLLQRWADEGVLPTFKQLIGSSLRADVTTPPGLSHAAMWVSLYTGTNPGRHGRSFPRRIKPGSYDLQVFDVDADQQVETVWRHLSRANRRVAIIDMVKAPLTQSLNGVQLVDWTTSGVKARTRSWPPSLASDIVARFGSDPLGDTSDAEGRGPDDYVLLAERMRPRIRMKTDLCRDLLTRERVDLFMTAFGEPHDVGHQCWHLHDPSHVDHDSEWVKRHGDPVRDVYVALDHAIAELIDVVGDQTAVMIFAGPGMQPLVTGNHLLETIVRRLDSGAAAPDSVAPRTMPAVAATWRSRVRRSVPSFARRWVSRARQARVTSQIAQDRRTRRFFVIPASNECGAIRINLAGREPDGLVTPSDYDTVCAQLAADLMELVSVTTGEPVVEHVHRARDVYHGSHVDELPDIMIEWRCTAPITGARSPKIGTVEGTFTSSRTGDHAPRAALYLRAPGITPGKLETPVPVEAIAPTIAALLGTDMPAADRGPIGGIPVRQHSPQI